MDTINDLLQADKDIKVFYRMQPRPASVACPEKVDL